MISQAAVINYSRLINLLDEDGKQKMLAELQALDWGDRETATRAAIEITSRYCMQYTEYASVIAAEFYSTCRDAEVGISTFEAYAGSHHDPASDEPAVLGMVDSVFASGSDGSAIEKFNRECLSRLGASVRSECIETVYSNGRRDPLRPRFARVPVPSFSVYGHKPGMTHNAYLAASGTCAFCEMLASRGFVYWSEESASVGRHTHDGCNCKVVPGFGRNPQVQGYDPRDYEGGYDEYRSQNHEVHDERTRERQRNYWREGAVAPGHTARRLDEKDVYTEAERKQTQLEGRRRANETRRRNQERRRAGESLDYERTD